MSGPSGIEVSATMADETTYGEDAASPVAVKLYLRGAPSVSESMGHEAGDLLTGHTEDAPTDGVKDVGGDLPLKMAAESIGKPLKHALGQVATTGLGPYVHTITIGERPAGFTLETDFGANAPTGGRYEKFNGCKIASMTVEGGGNKKPTINFGVKGAQSTLSDTPLDATPDDLGCTEFSLYEATLNEGGAAIATVLDWNINASVELSEDEYAQDGTGVRAGLSNGKTKVAVSVTAFFDSLTLLNKAKASTETSLKVILSRGTGDGSAGNEHLEFECGALRYMPSSPEVSGPGGVRVKLSGTAYGANALKAVLKNAVATI